jgi:N-acetylmuramoyl-L-alanine amidase
MINQTITQANNTRKIKNIVVHCTASRQSLTIDGLLKVFTDLGWKRPGYHYTIKADGTIVSLLPETLIANGVAGHNAGSIHISYIGGIDSGGKPIDNRTPHQKNSLRIALKLLKEKYPNAVIKGHRDFSPDTNKNGKVDWFEYIKQCPCFDAQVEYADIK